MSKTKTVRIYTTTLPKMEQVRSPGETDGQLIDRAISLLVEVKRLAKEFYESKEYQKWLNARQEI